VDKQQGLILLENIFFVFFRKYFAESNILYYFESLKQTDMNTTTTTQATKNLRIASTILDQIGGGRFLKMTGSKFHGLIEAGITFKLARNGSGANYLNISLTSADLYNMEFISIRGASVKTKAEIGGVYWDMLEEVFAQKTGLCTRF